MIFEEWLSDTKSKRKEWLIDTKFCYFNSTLIWSKEKIKNSFAIVRWLENELSSEIEREKQTEPDLLCFWHIITMF